MKLEEFLNSCEEDKRLEEGLRFFKGSKKLEKFADKIESRLIKTKEKGSAEEGQIKEIQKIVDEAKKAAEEFSDLEEKFSEKEIEKEEAKKQLKKLQKKYSGFLKKIKSDKTKSIMLTIGAASLLSGLLGALHATGLGTEVSKMSGSSFILKNPGQ